MTEPKPESELHNLVFGLTDIPHEKAPPWLQRPAVLAVIVIIVLVGLNLVFA